MNTFLSTPIEYLKGVGPLKADLLKKELRIFTFNDLLNYFPFRYEDRSKFNVISSLVDANVSVQLKGQIISVSEVGMGRAKRLNAQFRDETGVIDLVWFKGASWIKKSIELRKTIVIYGKVSVFGGRLNITHPEMSKFDSEEKSLGLQPVYSSTEKLNSKGLNSKGIQKIIKNLLPQIIGQIDEIIPLNVVRENKLISRETALINVHLSKSELNVKQARYRLKFEELFLLQMELLVRKKIALNKTKGIEMTEVGKVFNDFYANHIPFDLTGAQKRVLKEIRSDLKSGVHMNRLLQGDVGSGKTLVALLSILLAVGNGYQGALIAPTEILATQHFVAISEMLGSMNVKVDLLTGSTKKKARTILHERLKSGEISILIGTHALFEDVVEFNNLGIVVIDEQHRFGVAQRAKMRKKNSIAPHVLVMTATPIPRTLAMTFYGDLDVSVIDELPPGRKPITTYHKTDSSRSRVFGLMREEIEKGRQVYIVYPLIQESESLDYNNLMDGFEAIGKSFPKPEYQISIVHGKMKADDKEFEMQRFVKGETQIMVATTVIEVGVNVPNASIMVIESAERFGLSQLHQLRGRVGRGAEKSFCILMTKDKISPDSKKRMSTMVRTNDGFEISEVDLELRGPGDLLGTQQSGVLELKLADLAKDGQLVELSRKTAKTILVDDPELKETENRNLRIKLSTIVSSKPNWGKIA